MRLEIETGGLTQEQWEWGLFFKKMHELVVAFNGARESSHVEIYLDENENNFCLNRITSISEVASFEQCFAVPFVWTDSDVESESERMRWGSVEHPAKGVFQLYADIESMIMEVGEADRHLEGIYESAGSSGSHGEKA